ncbi:hypothetical protein [Dechloromonas sp. CZR5]|uniref:hypothetical protein n=1 Tax=Dechloromonas sp. CZR5 TaxID=2608630 RepID=UPI00123CAE27|nr:hypothetical protein [Dechloromonas sp. CZR5]
MRCPEFSPISLGRQAICPLAQRSAGFAQAQFALPGGARAKAPAESPLSETRRRCQAEVAG